MNNKGQTLVLFIVLLPIFLILFAYVFDFSYITIEKNKLRDIASLSIEYLVEDKKDKKDVEKVIIKNDKDIKINSITSNNVNLKKEIEPIFGKVIGIDKYDIKINLTGKIEKGKLIIEEKGK